MSDAAPRSAPAVTVRLAAPGDEARWRELFTAYGVFYETDFTPDVLDGVWAWIMDDRHPVTCLLAEINGTVVGFAHVRAQPDTFTAADGWFLDDLYTVPEARGSGAASALIAEIEHRAAERGGGTLRWITAADNHRAQALYDRLATRTTWVTYEKEIS